MDGAGIAARLRSMGGIARGRQLPASRAQLAHAVAVEAIERVRNGVFADRGVGAGIRAAAAHGGEVACVAALRHHGVWVLDDADTPHVWVGPNGRVHAHPDCACVTHRDEGVAAFGVVSLVRALVQSVECVGVECFFAAFESAWRKGLLTAVDRAEVRRRLSARHRWLVDIARGDADSGLESIVRLRLRRLGIVLEAQVFIAAVGLVDFLLAGCIILEIDGRENHHSVSHRHKDLVRDAEAAALGYETLRFDYALVIHDWPRVERAIVARLAAVRARTDARPVRP